METTLEAVETLRERVKERKIKEPEEVKACLREIFGGNAGGGRARPGPVRQAGGDPDDRGQRRGQDHHHRQAGQPPEGRWEPGPAGGGGYLPGRRREQLSVWAERAQVDIVKHEEGSDPAAVVFDAMNAAKARRVDVVLVDTAGRLHNKQNLMNELNKIRRVIDREGESSSKEVLLVLDATTGQNGLIQAKQFSQSAGITGIVLTKLDGTAKGGVVLAIAKEMGVPVKYVGLGEGIDDLQPL